MNHQRLVLCESCHRHIRSGEATCPFCQAQAKARDHSRAGVVVALALGAGVLGLSGCGGDTDGGEDPTGAAGGYATGGVDSVGTGAAYAAAQFGGTGGTPYWDGGGEVGAGIRLGGRERREANTG